MKLLIEMVVFIAMLGLAVQWVIGNGIKLGRFKKAWHDWGDPLINNTVITPWFYKWDIKDYYQKRNNKL